MFWSELRQCGHQLPWDSALASRPYAEHLARGREDQKVLDSTDRRLDSL